MAGMGCRRERYAIAAAHLSAPISHEVKLPPSFRRAVRVAAEAARLIG